ncbi:MAG: hypothetical protein WC294_06625, partial [Methanoregula sp.]
IDNQGGDSACPPPMTHLFARDDSAAPVRRFLFIRSRIPSGDYHKPGTLQRRGRGKGEPPGTSE